MLDIRNFKLVCVWLVGFWVLFFVEILGAVCVSAWSFLIGEELWPARLGVHSRGMGDRSAVGFEQGCICVLPHVAFF